MTAVEPERVTFLRSKDLAERWATSQAALAQLRYRGTGPKHVNIPGVGLRYRLSDIEAYEAGQ